MLLVAGISFTSLGAMPAWAQERPDPVVTSDSAEYCGELIDRIGLLARASHGPLPSEATALSEEGERMCGHGQTRGGILRLRRAILMLRHTAD